MSHTVSDPTTTTYRHAGADGPAIRRTAGVIAITGAVVMLASAILMYSTGSDVFTATDDRTMDVYLTEVTDHSTTLYVHLGLWIIGALSMAFAVSLFASTSRAAVSSALARFVTTAAAGAVVVFFPMMAGIIYGLGGRPELAPVAEALGSASTVADDIATNLILGVGLFAAVFSGRRDWAPTWLVAFGGAALATSLLSYLPVEAVAVATSYLIVLVGEAAMISMGIVGLRGRPVAAR